MKKKTVNFLKHFLNYIFNYSIKQLTDGNFSFVIVVTLFFEKVICFFLNTKFLFVSFLVFLVIYFFLFLFLYNFKFFYKTKNLIFKTLIKNGNFIKRAHIQKKSQIYVLKKSFKKIFNFFLFIFVFSQLRQNIPLIVDYLYKISIYYFF